MYDFACDEELDCFNRKMKTIGLSIQKDLFGGYIAFLDEYKYKTEAKKSGRKHAVMKKAALNTNQEISDGPIRDMSSDAVLS